MGDMIRMTMSDGAEIAVYHALPEGERRGGLVLVQEIFGVTDHIRELCDEYAADGYEALSPAIFDREHPGFEAAYTGPDYNRAVELARELHPFAQSLDDAQVCIDALKDKGKNLIETTKKVAGEAKNVAAEAKKVTGEIQDLQQKSEVLKNAMNEASQPKR